MLKNHEAASISGSRRAIGIAECGLKKKTPKSEIRNSKSEIRAGVFQENLNGLV
jgi:hypothetical protein